MPRKRMLSPEFFTSSTINELPIQAAMTFAGLWCYCDDYGRGEDDVTMIKATIWPRRRAISERKVAEDLAILADAGLICRYQVQDHALLHVISWSEHQKPAHPTASKLCPCYEHERAARTKFFESDAPYVQKYRSDSRGAHESLANDSRNAHEVLTSDSPQCSSVQDKEGDAGGTAPSKAVREALASIGRMPSDRTAKRAAS